MNFNSFIEIKRTKDSVLDKLKYLKNTGLTEYLTYSINLFGLRKLPNKANDQILQQIIPNSPNDLNKKIKHPEFYKAHLCCIKYVLEEMFLHDGFINNIEKYKPESDRDMLIYNYYNLLRELLFDMVLLLQDYEREIKNLSPSNFPLFQNPFQSDFTVYQFLPQTIFGQVSFHSFIEREPFVSIALIRQVVELKIRCAFGIYGIYDKAKDSFEPLSMSRIFDEIKLHKNDIDFAIPLENIIRINGWSNIFLHSGKKDYLWTTIFVYRYMHELIKGRKDMYTQSGIKLRQETLDNIIAGLDTWLKTNKPDSELIKSAPEALIMT